MKKSTVIFSGFRAVITLVLLFASATTASAVSTIAISPAGDGVFAVQGIGIEDASALEINVMYDATTLTNPRVVEGPLISGAMPAFNPNVPGMVRIVAIRISPIRGSGVIATISFTRTGSSPGKISALTAKLANVNGAPLLCNVQVANPPDTPAGSAPSSETPNSSSGGSTSGTTITGAGVVIVAPPVKTEDAGTSQPAQNTREETARSSDQGAVSPERPLTPAPAPESLVAKADDTVPVKSRPKMFTQKSVLQRFKDYKGERNADAFIALFDQESLIGCRQEPVVAISDGGSIVRVTFISPPGNLTSSDLAIVGARLLSLTRDPDNTNTWVVKLIPQKGTVQASLAVSQGELQMIYPLTVAPKVDIGADQSGKVTKAVFDRYFQKMKNNAPLAKDPNNDGRWDYQDDYIVTSNYLAAVRNANR